MEAPRANDLGNLEFGLFPNEALKRKVPCAARRAELRAARHAGREKPEELLFFEYKLAGLEAQYRKAIIDELQSLIIQN